MTSFLPFVQDAVDEALAGNTVKAAILTGGYDPDVETDAWSEASAFEPVDDGTTIILGDYPPGGVTQTVSTSITDGEVRFAGTGISITGATLPDISAVVFYVEETGALLAADLFAELVTVTDEWVYEVPAEGFLAYVAVADGF